MKKVIIIFAFILFVFCSLVFCKCDFGIFSTKNGNVLNNDVLQPEFYCGDYITIMGEYVFYQDERGFGYCLKAKNMSDNTEVLISTTPATDVFLYDGKLYYSGAKSLNPDNRIVYRHLDNSVERKLNNIPISDILIKNDCLYYKKIAYTGNSDSYERGNVFRLKQLRE